MRVERKIPSLKWKWILLERNYKEEIDQVKQVLNKTFKINNLRNLRYFLGVEVIRSKKGERDYDESKEEICFEIVNRCKSFNM